MYKAHSRISFLATFFAEDPHFYKDNRHHNSSTFVLSRAYHVQALTQCEKITDTHKSVSRGKKKFPSLSLSLSLSHYTCSPNPFPQTVRIHTESFGQQRFLTTSTTALMVHNLVQAI
jgi:hypothetical protein